MSLDLRLPEGSAIPSNITVISGNPYFNGNGFRSEQGVETEYSIGNILPDDKIDVVLTKEIVSSHYCNIKFRWLDNNNYSYAVFNISNGVFKVFEVIDGQETLLFDDQRDEYDVDAGDIRIRLDLKGSLVKLYINNATYLLSHRADITLNGDVNATGFRIRDVPGVHTLKLIASKNNNYVSSDLPKTIRGVKRVATKLGEFLPLPSYIDGTAEYAPCIVSTEGWPDWDSEKYPLALYSSPDHSAEKGGIHVRVYDSSEGSPVNSDGSVNSNVFKEWKDISNRPEFDHITTKTTLIYVDPNYRQCETPQLVYDNGTFYLFYHCVDVSTPASTNWMQQTLYVTSSNPFDFTGSTATLAFPEDPEITCGSFGHNGYFKLVEDVYGISGNKYIGKNYHGRGYSQIQTGDSPANLSEYRISSTSKGTLNQYNEWSEDKIFVPIIDSSMRVEGPYIRMLATYRQNTGGGAVFSSDLVELLTDKDLNIISRPKMVIPRGDAGEADSLEVQEGAEFSYKNRTYYIYNSKQADGSSKMLIAAIEEVETEWELSTTNAESAPLLSLDTPSGGVISDATSNVTPIPYTTSYPTQHFTGLPLPLDKSYATLLSNDSVDLSSGDTFYVEFHAGKNSYLPIELEVGLVDSLTDETSKLSLYFTPSSDSANADLLQFLKTGCYNEAPSNTSIQFGQKTGWFNSFESPKAKLTFGFKIIPSEQKLVVLRGGAELNVYDIFGFDFSKPLKAFVKGKFLLDQAAEDLNPEGDVAIRKVTVQRFSDSKIAVPSAPTLTTSKSSDTITLSTNNVSGATGYKYFLDNQSNETGVFTGLEPETEYTVYARSVNALGDSEPSTIQTVTTDAAAPDDTTAPVVTNNGPATLTLTVGDTYTPDFSTNEGNLVITGTPDTNTAGTYTVTATATDAAGNVGSATQTVIVEEVPANQTPDKIVVLGDSIQQAAFGQDLTNPSTSATRVFEWLGVTGVPVYGYAQSGDKVEDCILKAQTAYDTFGNTALYIIQIGTNDIHSPYTGFDQALSDQYQSLCDIFVNGGAEFILGTIPFKGDTINGALSPETKAIYENDTALVKPRNDNILLPIIQATTNPEYLMGNGVPVTDFYEQTRKHYFELLDDEDSTHYSYDSAYLLLRRLTYLFGVGSKPEPTIGEVSQSKFTLNFMGTTSHIGTLRTSSASNDEVVASTSTPISIVNKRGDEISLSVNINGSGLSQSVGLGPDTVFTKGYMYDDMICEELSYRGFYLSSNSTPVNLMFSNLKPSAEYSFKFFGCRISTATNIQKASWNGVETPPFDAFFDKTTFSPALDEPELLVETDEFGDLQIDIIPDNRTVYLSSISLEEVPSPLPTVSVGPNITSTEGDTVTLSGATASNYDSLQWTCATGQAPTFSDAAALNPDVTFNEAGLHTLRLTATNAEGSVFDELTADVQAIPNVPPTANAGPDQSVAAGALVQLDGSASYDTDGTIVGYGWVQSLGDTVDLDSDTIENPKFIAPSKAEPQALKFDLVVVDNEGATSAISSTTVNVAGVEQSDVLNILDKLHFTLDNDGVVTAYPGRSNRETFRFKPSRTENLVLDDDGYLNLEQNDIDRIEISVETRTGILTLSSKTAAINLEGSKAHCRLGDLQLDSSTKSFDLTFTVYVDGDEKGVVMIAPTQSGNASVKYYQSTIKTL